MVEQDTPFEGDIHIRDKTQFELTTEYVPTVPEGLSRYSLSFYFFIPASLQVSAETYSKEQFYLDQTNFIRLKTPIIALKGLLDPDSKENPLKVAGQMLEAKEEESHIVEELKLYANMVRSAVRDLSHIIWSTLHQAKEERDLRKGLGQLEELCVDIQAMRKTFLDWRSRLALLLQEGHVDEYVRYIDEFISTLCEHYEASLLQVLEQLEAKGSIPPSLLEYFTKVKGQLTVCMAHESQHRIENQERSVFADDPEKAHEYILYRKGILKKFVAEPLLLSMQRTEPRKKFLDIITPVIAGLAMLFYLYFLSFHSVHPIFDSGAFLLVTAILYVMRDRMKDRVRQIASHFSAHWFPDYQTIIRTPNGTLTLGSIKEWMHFYEEAKIPQEIVEIRKQHFHGELAQARRMEHVLCFSKTVQVYPKLEQREIKSHAFVDIFRYNIRSFLAKADDPYKEELMFNPITQRVEYIKSPKVYHIPIILQYDFVDAKGKAEKMYKCYRIILDKEGIKRIEKV